MFIQNRDIAIDFLQESTQIPEKYGRREKDTRKNYMIKLVIALKKKPLR